MKKFACILLSIIFLFSFAACAEEETADESAYSIVNGGFETGDLTGWTVESGNAFGEDNVTTKSTFRFEEDANHNELAIGQSGNWHLYGKGFDDKACGACAVQGIANVDRSELARDIYLVFTTREECGMVGGATGAYGTASRWTR